MGRFNKVTGEFTPKPSSLKLSSRLNQPAHPLPAFRKGTTVKVYMGAGWSAGIIEQSERDFCIIKLKKTGNRIKCSDARNVIVETPTKKQS